MVTLSARVRLTLDLVKPEDLDLVEPLLTTAPEIQPFYSRELVESWMREGTFLKAVEPGGQIIGVIHMRLVADAVWLEGIAVRPDIRRKGVGRQLAVQAMEFSGGSVFRIMASARNVPSNSLANSLGFTEVDRVYLLEGRYVTSAEIAEELNLRDADRSVIRGVRGFVDRLAWAPIEYYEGRIYYGNGVALLETSPPYFAMGVAEGYRSFTREPSPSGEEFIVYELRRPRPS